MIEDLRKLRVFGVNRDLMIRTFNTNYYNREYFKIHPAGRMHLDLEDNRGPYRPYFDEVLEFCYYHDVPKTLGLSAMDIFNQFDYGSFSRMRDFITRANNKRVAPMKELQEKMDAKYNKILKGK